MTTEAVSKWFRLNKLSLNGNKSNFIIFVNKNKKCIKNELKTLVNGAEISQVSSTKFLGVIVSEKLSWRDHINSDYMKIIKSIGIIRKISHLVSQKCLLTLYYNLHYITV